MEQQFTREEFYNLIWSKPIKDLAPDFGISDVALGKICRQLGMASPGRGYWAKLKAGTKLPPKPRLPPRGFGEIDIVTIGQESWVERKERLAILKDLPPKPEFSENIAELTARAKNAVGHIALPKTSAEPHHVILALLKSDERRRERAQALPYSSWEREGFFSSPFEKRRLRLLDAIFKGVEKVGLQTKGKGTNPQNFTVASRNGSQIDFKLDHPSTKERYSYHRSSAANRPATDKLRLDIIWHKDPPPGMQTTWEDGKNHKIEQDINNIVAGIAVAIEMFYRTTKIRGYEIACEERETRRRVENAVQEAKKEEERARLERTRKAQLARLFHDATAYRLAKDLRDYVTEVVSANRANENPTSNKDLQAWATWAREQADSIDPIKSKSFLDAPQEHQVINAISKPEPAQSVESLYPDSNYHSEDWRPNKWYTKLHRP
ncbi:hypothetical protein [Xanthomonas arboricola]|uniref:hypothetical protein n=1 Tax=Xanthomonas arboricola TaxID=56448 RepID=UPI0011B0F363|nr:hypothetical protein [Xanthomonas arboricola]